MDLLKCKNPGYAKVHEPRSNYADPIYAPPITADFFCVTPAVFRLSHRSPLENLLAWEAHLESVALSLRN